LKKNELRRYVNNKMQEKLELFPKNLAFMSLVKKKQANPKRFPLAIFLYFSIS